MTAAYGAAQSYMVVTLEILHIAIAAAWFGHKLLVPGDIRRSVHAGETESEALLERLRRAERLGILTGLGTLLSGGALMWVIGIDAVDIGIWVGLGLVLSAIFLGVAMGRPASKRLREAVTQGDRVEATIAGGQVGRALGLEGLLWLGALTSMVVV
jgi:hypothetical protein